jgi:putative membrane protein
MFMLEALPDYALFLATSMALLVVAMAIYIAITPIAEITLIRQGNAAAAVSFTGTSIGMALVLHSTAQGTFNVMELAVWGAVGLVGQLAVLGIVMIMIPGLRAGITEGKISYGILLGGLSVAMGLLNAGAMST